MNKNLVYFIIFLLSIKASSQNLKTALENLESKNQKCLDNGTNMFNCSKRFYFQSDSMLNVAYTLIRKNMSNYKKEELKKEQLQWLKKRDEKFKEIINQDLGIGNGLDKQMIIYQEKAELVNERTKFLLSQYDAILENTSNKFSKFIPNNYSILDTIRGDLNKDSFLDYVLILKRNREEITSNYGSDSPELRPLILLVSDVNNNLFQIARNDQSVYCFDCGGAMGDPYTGVTIKNGYFSIEHYGGSAWRWEKIITYKYSETEKEWFLYKIGNISYHIANLDEVTTIIKTKNDFGIIKFEDFNIYK